MNNEEKAQNAYYKARKGINVKEYEQIVLKCRTGWCYDFALNIPEADIKAHEKVILEIKNSELSYLFALYVQRADIKAHEKILLELKDPEYSCYFARDVPGANIEEHFKAVFNSGDKYWFNYFIKYVNYKNTKVEKWLMYI